MAEIRIKTNRDNDLTIVTIKGVLEIDDLLNALSEYFSNEATMNTIYDSTEGDWSKNSTEQYMIMIRSGLAFSREGAKVAMVFANAVDFGIGRMIESYCELLGYKNDHACFLSLEEARNWLSQTNR